MNKLRRLLILVAAFMLLSAAMPKEAEGFYWGKVFSQRDSEIFGGIEALGEGLGFPENDEPSLLIIQVDPAGVVIKVIGSEGLGLRSLTEALDRWESASGQRLTRKWMEELRSNTLVSASIDQLPPVHSPNAGLPDLERLAGFMGAKACLLWVSDDLTLKAANRPKVKAGGGSVWVMNDTAGWWRPEGATGTDPLAQKRLFEFLLWIPILGLLVTWAWAQAGARSEGSKTLAGREVYAKRVLSGTLWFCFAPFLLLGVVLLSGRLDAYALWGGRQATGPQSVGLFLPFIVLTGILVGILLLAMNPSVFGPSQEEKQKGNRNAPRSPLVVMYPGWRLFPHLPWIGLLITVASFPAYLLTGIRPIFFIGFPMGMVSLLLLVVLALWVGKKGVHLPAHKEAIQALQEVLDDPRLVQKGKKLKPSLLKLPHIPRFFALTTGGQVAATPEMLDEVGPEAVKFVVAHEIGHVVLRHIAVRRLLRLALFLAALLPLAVWTFVIGPSHFGVIFGLLAPSSLSLVLLASYGVMRKVYVQQEFEADAWAVKTLGSSQGGVAALTALSEGSPLPGLNYVNLIGTHPPVQERMRRMAEAVNPLQSQAEAREEPDRQSPEEP